MGEPRIRHRVVREAGPDCTVRPAVMGVGPGAVSAVSYAGAREELAALLGRPEVARGLAGMVLAQLRVMGLGGVPFPEWATPMLRCLHQVAAGGEMSDVAPGPVTVGVMSEALREGWPTVSQAAAQSNRSVAHVRRLVASGAVRGARLGPRAWVVDPVSLRSVIYKSGVRVVGGRS